jgi:type 1 glutamine amidotransferase
VDDRIRVLLVTKGHPFQREPFFEVFDADTGIVWTHVEQPAAEALFHPERGDRWDVFVMYDMPGIEFTRGDPPARFPDPPADYVAGLEALLESGKPMVFLHHAIAGWPAWPGYADIMGGRFLYQPGVLRGVAHPDSGYRFDVDHHVEVIDPSHPVCAGLSAGFDIVDELYLFPVFEDDVVPLMRTTFPMDDPSLFSSADLAIRGQRDSNEGWVHGPGSALVAWAKHAGRSPIVYLQFGDGPETYANPSYRRALGNAIRWAASPDAAVWAQARAAAG